MTPADTLSCRQTNPENIPNLALSLTVWTLDPLTDTGHLRRGPWLMAPVLTRRLERRFILSYAIRQPSAKVIPRPAPPEPRPG
jgi:hypothetical protein